MIIRLVFSYLPKSQLNPISMAIRKMKPSKVDMTINKRLKSANFFNQFQ